MRLGVSRYNDGGVGETLEALAARAETWCTKQSWCSALIEGCGGWEKKYEGEGARLLLADGRLGRLGWRRCSWLERGWFERTDLALSYDKCIITNLFLFFKKKILSNLYVNLACKRRAPQK